MRLEGATTVFASSAPRHTTTSVARLSSLDHTALLACLNPKALWLRRALDPCLLRAALARTLDAFPCLAGRLVTLPPLAADGAPPPPPPSSHCQPWKPPPRWKAPRGISAAHLHPYRRDQSVAIAHCNAGANAAAPSGTSAVLAVAQTHHEQSAALLAFPAQARPCAWRTPCTGAWPRTFPRRPRPGSTLPPARMRATRTSHPGSRCALVIMCHCACLRARTASEGPCLCPTRAQPLDLCELLAGRAAPLAVRLSLLGCGGCILSLNTSHAVVGAPPTIAHARTSLPLLDAFENSPLGAAASCLAACADGYATQAFLAALSSTYRHLAAAGPIASPPQPASSTDTPPPPNHDRHLLLVAPPHKHPQQHPQQHRPYVHCQTLAGVTTLPRPPSPTSPASTPPSSGVLPRAATPTNPPSPLESLRLQRPPARRPSWGHALSRALGALRAARAEEQLWPGLSTDLTTTLVYLPPGTVRHVKVRGPRLGAWVRLATACARRRQLRHPRGCRAGAGRGRRRRRGPLRRAAHLHQRRPDLAGLGAGMRAAGAPAARPSATWQCPRDGRRPTAVRDLLLKRESALLPWTACRRQPCPLLALLPLPRCRSNGLAGEVPDELFANLTWCLHISAASDATATPTAPAAPAAAVPTPAPAAAALRSLSPCDPQPSAPAPPAAAAAAPPRAHEEQDDDSDEEQRPRAPSPALQAPPSSNRQVTISVHASAAAPAALPSPPSPPPPLKPTLQEAWAAVQQGHAKAPPCLSTTTSGGGFPGTPASGHARTAPILPRMASLSALAPQRRSGGSLLQASSSSSSRAKPSSMRRANSLTVVLLLAPHAAAAVGTTAAAAVAPRPAVVGGGGRSAPRPRGATPPPSPQRSSAAAVAESVGVAPVLAASAVEEEEEAWRVALREGARRVRTSVLELRGSPHGAAAGVRAPSPDGASSGSGGDGCLPSAAPTSKPGRGWEVLAHARALTAAPITSQVGVNSCDAW